MGCNYAEGDFFMQYDLIMCGSLTYAQRAQKALERTGIPASVVKAPQGASAAGCAYGVRVNTQKRTAALAVLTAGGLPVGNGYRWEEDGSLTEVSV